MAPNRSPYGGPERAVKSGRNKGRTGTGKKLNGEYGCFPKKKRIFAADWFQEGRSDPMD